MQSRYASVLKQFCFTKNGSIFNFPQKLQNTKMLYPKTVLDRAILMNFYNHMVSVESSHANFQNIFVSPKIVAILNFQIFCKNCKTQ